MIRVSGIGFGVAVFGAVGFMVLRLQGFRAGVKKADGWAKIGAPKKRFVSLSEPLNPKP